MGFKLRKLSQGEDPPVEINVTPMIDMFSVILSFLLMTAVFSATGIHVVQIPFLSSASPDDDDKPSKPTTVATLMVDNQSLILELGKSNSSAITERKTFSLDESGLSDLQLFLYNLRRDEPEFDRVTLMTDDDTRYDNLVKVFDALRFLDESLEALADGDGSSDESMLKVHQGQLIPKIVLGNIIL